MSNSSVKVVSVNQEPSLPAMVQQGETTHALGITRIPLDAIEPNPKQPRTEFNEQYLNELAASIKTYDVVQPITVTRLPTGTYRLVSGERRWRASKIAGLKDIPAYVRPTEDIQLLPLAILENLHREQLNPMEQAYAFKALSEECNMTVKDIAAEFGRGEHFVRQQLKLLELIAPWQKIASKKGISMSVALAIASLSQPVQKELYKNYVTPEAEKAEKPVISISHHTLNNYRGLLSEVIFDLKDATLDTKAGACIHCPFNSANYSLYSQDEMKPICNHVKCLNNKTIIHKNREFNKAKDDPSVVLVYNAYSTAPDTIKQLKADGNVVFRIGYGDDCVEVEEPLKPEWEAFEAWGKGRSLKNKDIKAKFKEEESSYPERKARFDEQLAAGKIKKAFVMHDTRDSKIGRYVYIQMNPPKQSAKTSKAAIASGNPTPQDITNEIDRLSKDAARQDVLVEEKVQKQILELLPKSALLKQIPKTARKVDHVLMKCILLELVKYDDQTTIEKLFKKPNLFHPKRQEDLVKVVQSLSNQHISYLLHKIVVDKFLSDQPKSFRGLLTRAVAESLQLPIAKMKAEHQPKAEKRKANIKIELKKLHSLKRQLNASSNNTPATKESTNKRKKAA